MPSTEGVSRSDPRRASKKPKTVATTTTTSFQKKPLRRARHGKASHIIVIFLLFTGILFLALVHLYNAPLTSTDYYTSASDYPTASELNRRWWLVRVSTGTDRASIIGKLGDGGGLQPEIAAVPHNVRGYSLTANEPPIPQQRRTRFYPSEESIATLEARKVPVWSEEPPAPKEEPAPYRQPTKEYGFGTWGWCSWSATAPTGFCITSVFWMIPGTASEGTDVANLKLPSSIGTSLSIAAFLIVIPLAWAIGLLIVLLIILCSPPRLTQPIEGPLVNPLADVVDTGENAEYCARNAWWGSMALLVFTAFLLTPILCAGIGVSEMSTRVRVAETGNAAQVGIGLIFLIIAWVILFAAQLTIWWGGLMTK